MLTASTPASASQEDSRQREVRGSELAVRFLQGVWTWFFYPKALLPVEIPMFSTRVFQLNTGLVN